MNPNLQPGNQAFDDTDDSIYKSHILYIIPNDPNCVAVEKLLTNNPIEAATWIQNVKKLPTPLPSWLRGVPTLLCKQEGQVHMGRNIQLYLQSILNGNGDEAGVLLPGGGALTGVASRLGGGSYEGAGLEAPGAYTLEYDKTPDEITGTTVMAQQNMYHTGASFNSPGVFHDEEVSQQQPGNMVAASAARMQQAPDSRNTGGVRDRRRQEAQHEHQRRLQAMQEARNEQDRRLNPNPNYQL